MTHAMLFNGVDLNSQDKPVKWRVENSWGTKGGEKGYGKGGFQKGAGKGYGKDGGKGLWNYNPTGSG